MTVKSYLLSFPERVVRSMLGVSAGVAREIGEVTLPDGVRRSQLYQNLVDTTLRFLIEQVGGARGVYQDGDAATADFLARRTVGNAVELLGIVAFRASPVWVLAALADVSGAGRTLIPEIAAALKAEGLLEKEAQYTTLDQMLDGLERTSSRLASTINTPPLDVAGLREEWTRLRAEAAVLPVGSLPSRESIVGMWTDLEQEAARQDASIFATSSALAIAAVRALPENVRWLAASARVGATTTGAVLGEALFAHYRTTLAEIRQAGYFAYTGRQLSPYVRAAARQFSPSQRTLTEKLIDRFQSRK